MMAIGFILALGAASFLTASIAVGTISILVKGLKSADSEGEYGICVLVTVLLFGVGLSTSIGFSLDKYARPKRKNIPDRIKRVVVERQGGLCLCGCWRPVHWRKHKTTTRFDHTPGIFLRTVNAAGTDYVPPQLYPDYIVARCVESDENLRSGGKSRATTAGRQTNANAKQRKREKPPEPKRAWGSRPLRSGKTTWPTRKIENRGFQKRGKT